MKLHGYNSVVLGLQRTMTHISGLAFLLGKCWKLERGRNNSGTGAGEYRDSSKFSRVIVERAQSRPLDLKVVHSRFRDLRQAAVNVTATAVLRSAAPASPSALPYPLPWPLRCDFATINQQ